MDELTATNRVILKKFVFFEAMSGSFCEKRSIYVRNSAVGALVDLTTTKGKKGLKTRSFMFSNSFYYCVTDWNDSSLSHHKDRH